MAKFGKILFVFAVVSIMAAVAFFKISKDKIVLNDIQDCPSLLMRGTPTIASYGSDFVTLQSLHPQRLRAGQSYSFEQIIYGPPYEVKVRLLNTGNQGDFLVTEEDLFTYSSEFDQEREHVKYACKQPVSSQTYSPLNNISSLFVNFDFSEWEILNAIEMVSNHESFRSNATHHYVVYINGKSKDTPKENAIFDATVDILYFEENEAAHEYYRIQSGI
jgi:hypothetical protein